MSRKKNQKLKFAIRKRGLFGGPIIKAPNNPIPWKRIKREGYHQTGHRMPIFWMWFTDHLNGGCNG